jgi:hypothetical protein
MVYACYFESVLPLQVLVGGIGALLHFATVRGWDSNHLNNGRENSVAQLRRVPDSEVDGSSDNGVACLAELPRNLEVFEHFVLWLLCKCVVDTQLNLMVRSIWSLQLYANLPAPPESFPS